MVDDNKTLQETLANESQPIDQLRPPVENAFPPPGTTIHETTPPKAPTKRPRGRPRKIPPGWTPEGPPKTPDRPPQDYGQELILDIHDADPTKFTRMHITSFMKDLCEQVIFMDREDLHFWDYEEEPELKAKQPAHLKGISAVQFIKTSNITIHTLDDLKKVFVNIFSCKKFNPDAAEKFSLGFFQGRTAQRTHTIRK